ncbi:hypothetical protein R3I94_011898 [Phoxinus phoxinus]
MYLACIVGSFVILFAESSPYEDSREAVTVQTIAFYDNKEDLCNAKMAIKCCICLEMIKKYIPIINAVIDKKINSVCSPNLLFWRTCRQFGRTGKNMVIKGYFPGSPLKSCIKYKMCKVKD